MSDFAAAGEAIGGGLAILTMIGMTAYWHVWRQTHPSWYQRRLRHRKQLIDDFDTQCDEYSRGDSRGIFGNYPPKEID